MKSKSSYSLFAGSILNSIYDEQLKLKKDHSNYGSSTNKYTYSSMKPSNKRKKVKLARKANVKRLIRNK